MSGVNSRHDRTFRSKKRNTFRKKNSRSHRRLTRTSIQAVRKLGESEREREREGGGMEIKTAKHRRGRTIRADRIKGKLAARPNEVNIQPEEKRSFRWCELVVRQGRDNIRIWKGGEEKARENLSEVGLLTIKEEPSPRILSQAHSNASDCRSNTNTYTYTHKYEYTWKATISPCVSCKAAFEGWKIEIEPATTFRYSSVSARIPNLSTSFAYHSVLRYFASLIISYVLVYRTAGLLSLHFNWTPWINLV